MWTLKIHFEKKKKKCNSPSPLPLHFYIMYISWFLIGVNGRCPLVRQLKMPKVKDTTQEKKKRKLEGKKNQTYRGEIAYLRLWDTYISRSIFICCQCYKYLWWAKIKWKKTFKMTSFFKNFIFTIYLDRNKNVPNCINLFSFFFLYR